MYDESHRTKTALRLIEELHRNSSRKHHLQRLLEQNEKEEIEARRKLANELHKILKAHPEAIADGLLSHWCFAVEDKELHRLAFEQHQREIAEKGSAAAVVVHSEVCPDCGHSELSDGYGNNDCPECGHKMAVHSA